MKLFFGLWMLLAAPLILVAQEPPKKEVIVTIPKLVEAELEVVSIMEDSARMALITTHKILKKDPHFPHDLTGGEVLFVQFPMGVKATTYAQRNYPGLVVGKRYWAQFTAIEQANGKPRWMVLDYRPMPNK